MTTDDRPASEPATASRRPGHQRLEIFVGTWRTEGEILDASGATRRLRATDTYEWLPGGFFLVHRVDGRMGDEEVRVLEIIGYDAASDAYFTHSYDNHGGVAEYEATLHDRAWSILGRSERFTGTFDEGGTALTGTWERRAEGGEWTRWMTIRLTKVR
jgi:hypothetical protein